jgi:hypothetical protein
MTLGVLTSIYLLEGISVGFGIAYLRSFPLMVSTHKTSTRVFAMDSMEN